MTAALCLALLSAITMAGVYLTDAVMAGTTYSRPSQPMFVSSAFAFLPAPLLLLWGWHMPSAQAASLAFCAGAVLALTSWLYFRTMYSEAGECSEIALYESANSLLVTAATGLMFFVGLTEENLLPVQWGALVVGGAGLFAVQAIGEKISLVTWRYRLLLIVFSVGAAAFKLLLDYALAIEVQRMGDVTPAANQAAFVAVTPFFWAGMALGVASILPRKEWTAFRKQFTTIREKWWQIALVEVLALTSFICAVLAIAHEHVATVTLIADSFPIFVMIGGVLIRRSFRIESEKLSPIHRPLLKFLAVAAVVCATYVAVR